MTREDALAELLESARMERTHIWIHILDEARRARQELPSNIDALGQLYTDLRLDIGRVQAAIDAGGSLAGIEVDPRPEDVPEGIKSLADDYFDHVTLVVATMIETHAMETFDAGNPAHMALYQETAERLFEQGVTVNPLY